MLNRIEPVLCFAHLRWNFVYQRPQHVMTRLAARRPVFYYEEPQCGASRPGVVVRSEGNVRIATPQIPNGMDEAQSLCLQRRLLDDFLAEQHADAMLIWYYTPMAFEFSRHLEALRIYDCMDELSAFKNAPANIQRLEHELLNQCALIFTGGRSLYYAKRRLHSSVYCFPSAVDERHFAPAARPEPSELHSLGRPRLVFCGVIDERFDVHFVRALASELTEWQVVLIGPTTKIDPATLPRADNLHYFGMRPYDALPAYLQHCDVALLPFALNEATRFISPTKTLEYLAARKPVISTPIADVVDPYGTEGLVHISTTARDAAHAARALAATTPSAAWHASVDEVLTHASWDATVAEMERLIGTAGFAEIEAAG